jgi:hypothetical protein
MSPRHFINGSEVIQKMPQSEFTTNLDYIIPMALEKEDDNASEVGPAALLRLEIRYLRRDIGELKEEVRKGLESKADRAQLSTVTVDDHEKRIRALEQRVYWALGFGAAAGVLGGWAAKLILH